ncbi:ninja-family protein AFP3-like [Rutidosis leptorrhynchoides]|uniref:ninja-family protein AFP3-like n=1 Tax=Rutidosis leptorrhynchoides TaxID=125765 RepID=UPI003A99829A
MMDFLKKFTCDGGNDGGVAGNYVKQEPLGEETVELNLGLSLNGQFGVNNNYDNNNRLIRASSIAEFSFFPSSSVTDHDPTSLTRTCSLPVETAVEWRKRKEEQSLRRSEAKRKRFEKIGIRNLMNGNELLRSSPPSSLLPPRPVPLPGQVSVGSPGSGVSSGVSDLESQPSSENKDTEPKNAPIQPSVSHKISNSMPHRSNSVSSEHASMNFSMPSSRIIKENRSKNDTLKMMLSDMPCVSTKGDGVNGKIIEGFLYRYRKGEEVRIVCVCHGSFLTPAEFVKHGGGGDVEHPLRHIVVVPPSL